MKIPKYSDVFLVDHAWSHDGGAMALQQLKNMPQLVSRMQNLFGIVKFNDELTSANDEVFGCENAVCKICNCSIECARSALKEHKGSVLDAIMEVIVGDAPKESSKDNIECTFQEFKLAVKSCEDGIYLYDVSDEYLKRMYESFKRVNGQNIGSAMTSNYSWLDNEDSGFIEVHIAIKSNTHKQDIKSILKTNHWHLEINGMGVLIDGDFTDSVVTDESFWAIESPGILTMYLRKGRTMKRLWIELIKGEKQLSSCDIEEALWKRSLKMTAEMKDVLDEMWKYSQTYCITSISDNIQSSAPVWYVMDEVGSAIGHSSTPNFACQPFYLHEKRLTLNIIWPLKDIEFGEEITRMFIQKPCHGESFANFDARVNTLIKNHEHSTFNCFEEEATNLFEFNELIDSSEAMKEQAIQPIGTCSIGYVSFNEVIAQKKTFFCDYINNADFAKISMLFGCNVTSDVKSADYVLSRSQLSGVSNQSMVNHFIGEKSLVNKLLFNAIAGKRCANFSWYHRIYDLRTEISKILLESTGSHYNQMWVLRTDDSEKFNICPVLTSDTLRIIRLVESGLTVATKYVPDLVKYNGRCFALSYLLYIKRLLPTEIFIHKIPYVRQAPAKYNFMTLLNEYETTAIFTEKPRSFFSPDKPQDFTEFVKAMEEISCRSGLEKSWMDIEIEIIESIGTLIRVFEDSLTSQSDTNSFGIIGVDFLLDSRLNPIFLSFNHFPYFATQQVLKDVIFALLCRTVANVLPSENSFFQLVF